MSLEQTKVCVVGTCVLDVRVGPVVLDVPLGKQAIRKIETPTEAVGGIVGNVGIQLARLGMNVLVATRIGDDAWGRTIRDQLSDAGVDTTGLEMMPDVSSGVAFCFVGPTGDRVFMTSPGPHRQLDASYLQQATEDLQQDDVLVLAYYSRLKAMEDGMAGVLARLAGRGVRVVMDAAGDGGSLQPLDECLPHLWLYAPSYEEACAQTGESDPGVILDCFRGYSPSTVLALKHGIQGAWVDDGQYRVHQPALETPGDIVDTIGAGDAFVAGLTAALLRGASIAEAAKMAAANASISLTGTAGWQAAVGWSDLQAFAAVAKPCGLA